MNNLQHNVHTLLRSQINMYISNVRFCINTARRSKFIGHAFFKEEHQKILTVLNTLDYLELYHTQALIKNINIVYDMLLGGNYAEIEPVLLKIEQQTGINKKIKRNFFNKKTGISRLIT